VQAFQMTGWQQDPELREVPEPEPGAGQVVVRGGAAGACLPELVEVIELARAGHVHAELTRSPLDQAAAAHAAMRAGTLSGRAVIVP
jgi:D-arabinose 1-dehydrogenase-like Zn-dependent alcohol dehydrogenase